MNGLYQRVKIEILLTNFVGAKVNGFREVNSKADMYRLCISKQTKIIKQQRRNAYFNL